MNNFYIYYIEVIFFMKKGGGIMVPFWWFGETFNEYITRIQKTSKKTQWKRNRRKQGVII